MNITARKYERRQLAAKVLENQKVAERRRLFSNAFKALKRVPLDIDTMPFERQVELIQDYVRKLEGDIAMFDALYSDSGGRSAAIVIRRERYRALDELAKLRIKIARGDVPPPKVNR